MSDLDGLTVLDLNDHCIPKLININKNHVEHVTVAVMIKIDLPAFHPKVLALTPLRTLITLSEYTQTAF